MPSLISSTPCPNDFPDFMRLRPRLFLWLRRVRWMSPEDLFPMFLVMELENPGDGSRKLRNMVEKAYRHEKKKDTGKRLDYESTQALIRRAF